jgi:hypothetical protein
MSASVRLLRLDFLRHLHLGGVASAPPNTSPGKVPGTNCLCSQGITVPTHDPSLFAHFQAPSFYLVTHFAKICLLFQSVPVPVTSLTLRSIYTPTFAADCSLATLHSTIDTF